ncbi:hypothetical protein ACJJTC_007070 [Scirpophaga incertulas]
MKFKRGYYDIFIQTCAKNPSKTAVKHFENGMYKNYTYSELYGICEYIAQNLQQIKCRKGVIGIVSERNAIIPSVLAAVHKCYTTFMFINPLQCIEKIICEVHLTVIITIKESDKSGPPVLLNKIATKTVSVFNLDISFYDLKPLNEYSYLQEYSFIATTSGSTGEPKHILVPVQCLQPNIDDFTNLFEISPNDVIYFSTPLTFDPSMIEILLAFANGASLLIAPEKTNILFPNNTENSITFWQTTPSKFFQHSNEDIKNIIFGPKSTLKVLALGGEPLNGIKRLKKLKNENNKTKIFTLYGVTEMSCWACATELDLNKIHMDREIPLGNCLSETQIHVKTECSNNNTGTIILASKSRKCSILNKLKGHDENNTLNVIDTGDLGMVKNGTIYYRGRKDDIVKRFGVKINLQFIETIVMQCPEVKTCSCVWLPKPMLLVVYYSSETLKSCELSKILRNKLDDKHWPDKILRVDSIPMNSHGKISKQAVVKLYETLTNIPKTFDFLKDCFVKELQNLMNKTVTYEDIKNHDFLSFGGTSFLAMAICNKMSLTYPEISRYILPLLITKRNTIDEIMHLAHAEMFVNEVRAKKKLKRSVSDTNLKRKGMKKKNELKTVKYVEMTIMWTFDTGKCIDASPALINIGINCYCIVGSHSGKIIVASAMTGELEGMITIQSRVEASVFCYWNECNDAMTACGVVGAYDGTIVCFTISNCQEIWRINIDAMIKSKATYCNGMLYIASYDGKVRCIDLTNGRVKDVIDITAQAISADLVTANGKYVMAGALSADCVCVDAATNCVAWRFLAGSPVFASPVVYANYVLFAEVKGEIHCRTVEEGIQVVIAIKRHFQFGRIRPDSHQSCRIRPVRSDQPKYLEVTLVHNLNFKAVYPLQE